MSRTTSWQRVAEEPGRIAARAVAGHTERHSDGLAFSSGWDSWAPYDERRLASDFREVLLNSRRRAFDFLGHLKPRGRPGLDEWTEESQMMTTELTVGELLERLRDLPDDTPVRLAKQTGWQLENHLGEPLVMEFDFGEVVYLPEAEEVGSLPGDVSAEMGWR